MMRSVGAQQQIFALRPYRQLMQPCCFRNIDEFSVLEEVLMHFKTERNVTGCHPERQLDFYKETNYEHKSGKQIDLCGTPTLGRFTVRGQTESSRVLRKMIDALNSKDKITLM